MNCTYDNESEGGRRWEGEIDGWRWRIVRKDKEKDELEKEIKCTE